MKKLIFCLQNELIERVLKKNKIIDSDSFVIKDKQDLKLDLLKKINPEFIFFPHWSYKVNEEIIKNYKCICFHSAPLPYGRGGSPIQNMIIRGHKETEVCSLLMEEEFDAGPVFLRTPVSLKGNLDEILIRIYEAIAEQIKLFKEKEIKPEEQEGEIVKFRRLKEEDNQINFLDDSKKIFDQIRMLDCDLYPSSYVNIGDYKIEFTSASLNKGILECKAHITKQKK